MPVNGLTSPLHSGITARLASKALKVQTVAAEKEVATRSCERMRLTRYEHNMNRSLYVLPIVHITTHPHSFRSFT